MLLRNTPLGLWGTSLINPHTLLHWSIIGVKRVECYFLVTIRITINPVIAVPYWNTTYILAKNILS